MDVRPAKGSAPPYLGGAVRSRGGDANGRSNPRRPRFFFKMAWLDKGRSSLPEIPGLLTM
jgi:hypothetical protein